MVAEQLQLIEVEKLCPKCGIVKCHIEFSRRSGPDSALRTQCKFCISAYNAAYIKTPNGQEAMTKARSRWAEYIKTPEGKAIRRAAAAAWDSTPRGNASRHASSARRRASIAIESTLTAAEWTHILTADRGCCHYCGVAYTADNPPTQDHVIPLSKGGQHTKENVVSACQSCNSSKGASLDWISDKVEAT